jgi:hypothetical protein
MAKQAAAGLAATDYSGLKAEIQSDPGALGYAAYVTAGNDQGVADLLNQLRSGTSPDGKTYSVFRTDVDPREIVNCIATPDFNAATAIQFSKLQVLFQGAPIDCTLPNVRANLQAVFSGASAATTSALAAVVKRNASRAEVLYGVGTVITTSDISFALRGTR